MQESENQHSCSDCGLAFDKERQLWGHQASCDGSGWNTKENLERLYIDQGLSTYEIGEKYGKSGNTVSQALESRGIERRSISEARGGHEGYKDRDTMKELYIDRGLSTIAIADMMDVSRSTILYWLVKHGIERRNRGKYSHPHENKPSKEALEQWYCEEKRSMEEIAELRGVSYATVSNWLESYGIPKRTQAESLALKVPPVEELRRLHWEDGLKLCEIAEKYDVNNRTVSGWFTRREIDVRTYYGEEAANWSGGHEKYYGPNWIKQREKRIEYDGAQCVVCGMDSEEHKEAVGHDLEVHHIQKLKSFKTGDGTDYESANRLENLITMCRSCHAKWEGVPLKPQT